LSTDGEGKLGAQRMIIVEKSNFRENSMFKLQ